MSQNVKNNALNTRVLNTAGALLVVILIGWLLIVGRDLLIPLIVALIIWYLLDTISRYLQRFSIGAFSIPYPLALGCACAVLLAVILLVVDLVASNAAELTQRAPQYQENIQHKLQGLLAMIMPSNADFSLQKLNDLLNVQKLIAWISGVIGSVISNMALVVVYLLFLFLEQFVFERKFSALFNDQEQHERAQALREEIMQRIRVYLSVKTFVSVLTGLLSAVILRVIGVDYAMFWGFIIFMLNYIPNIGSLLGAMFPAALSLVQFDSSWPFFMVLLLVGSLQFLVGNVLEPRLMGSNLNLSGLVILIALAVWGSIWGITGMILSVPITVVILIICARFTTTRPIAILLSSDGRV